MAVFLENVHFTPGESLRLLRWQGNARSLQSLEAGGIRTPVTGVGGRWHSHLEMEFTIFERGSGTRYVGDHVGPFTKWDCVLLGSELPHSWQERGETDGQVLQFHLPPEHPLRRLGGAAELQRLFAGAERGLNFRAGVAQKTLALLERMAAGSELARAGLLLELLALLADAAKRHAVTLSQSRVCAEVDASIRPRVEAVVQWVLEHFTEPLSLEQAVKRSAMSRATFCRRFRRHTGKTLVAFVTDARLAHAHRLITQTEHSITDIAFESGFGSLSRFNTAFRARFGQAPREMRRHE